MEKIKESENTLHRIQEVLREAEWPENETEETSSQIKDLMNAHTAVIGGLLFILEEDDLTHIRKTEGEAIRSNWLKLSRLLEKREQEHIRIWNLAFRGDENKNI